MRPSTPAVALWREEYRNHIDEIRTAFGHLKAEPRLIGGARVCQQFEDTAAAVACYGDSQAGAVYERVNEIVLAQHPLGWPVNLHEQTCLAIVQGAPITSAIWQLL